MHWLTIFYGGTTIFSCACWYKVGWYYGHLKGRQFQRDNEVSKY